VKISAKPVLYGACIGATCALLVATVPTALDWNSNPGGIFRSETGTDFAIALETWYSWFWPVAIFTIPGASLLFVALSNRSAANDT
jgi:hypothetical protein